MSIPLGSVIYTAVKPIFKIYMIMGVGFILARRNVLTVETSRNISDIIVTAILPCLIFNKVVGNLEGSDIKAIGVIALTATIYFVCGGFLTHFLGVAVRSPKAWAGGIITAGLFSNVSDLPIAYIQTMDTGSIFTVDEGNKGVAYVCIFLAVQVFYQFNMGGYRLTEYDFRDSLKADEESKLGDEKVRDVSVSNETPIAAGAIEFSDSDSISSSRSSIDSEVKPSPNQANEYEQHKAFLDIHSVSARNVPTLALSTSSKRRGSNSSNNSSNSLQKTRTLELRHQKSQNIDDIIIEYSEAEALRDNEVKQTVTGISDISIVKPERKEQKKDWFERHNVGFLGAFITNFKKPNSISLIVSVIVAMAPPLRALFLQTSYHMPNAPDDLPPLSFLMDFTSYIGAAAVPLGLLILGGTIARLQISSMPAGFWKTMLGIALVRLVILPIIGISICTKLKNIGWYDDRMILFVCCLESALPSATSLVYFTAFYTDPNSPTHVQMDCLAVALIFQYIMVVISLPFAVTYVLKVTMGV